MRAGLRSSQVGLRPAKNEAHMHATGPERWRIRVRGQGNPAVTSRMDDGRETVVAPPAIVGGVSALARDIDEVRGSDGRVEPSPGGTNGTAPEVYLELAAEPPD